MNTRKPVLKHNYEMDEKHIHPLPKHKRGEKFLKGPVPWKWLKRAASMRGKTLHVSVMIWHIAFMKGHAEVVLSNKRLSDFGVSRHSKYRALSDLEDGGLISVQRHNNRSPTIRILDVN